MANDDQTTETNTGKDMENRLLSSMQENIVTAVVFRNDDQTDEIVRLLDLEWFEDPYRDIVARALKQREDYQQAPGITHVDDIFGHILFDESHKQHVLYNRILRGMMAISETMNTEFVLDRLHVFARRQCFKRAIFAAATILSQAQKPEDYDKVEEILTDVGKFRSLTTLPVMSIQALLEREYPLRVKILGDLITNLSRVLLVGPKGKGKTRLMLEMALSIAMGRSFLHWQGSGQALRVLYIDGELGGNQFKDLYLVPALRRYQPFPDTMFFLFHDDFPDGMPKLNTSASRRMIERAIDKYAPDAIVFDNIQCLLEYDDSHGAKTWNQTLPMVRSLTARNIAQIWGDHTGHNTTRNGDTDKKTWQMDSVGLMSETPGTGDIEGVLQFTLDFRIKHRPANSDNWRDFQDVDIKFADNEWSFVPSKQNKKNQDTGDKEDKLGKKQPSDEAIMFYEKLMEVIEERGMSRDVGEPPEEHQTVREKADWKAECWIDGLLGEKSPDKEELRRQHARFGNIRRQLVSKSWIGKHHEDNDEYFIWNIHT